MNELMEKLDVERLQNLVESFGWELKEVERLDEEVIVSFSKRREEDIPREAVGAD